MVEAIKAEAKSDHEAYSQISSSPSDYSDEYYDEDDADQFPNGWYFGSKPKSEETVLQEMRDKFIETLDRKRAEQRKISMNDKLNNTRDSVTPIFDEVKEFTAGAIRYFPDGTKKYVPLFPYFYCQDVQKGYNQGSSASSSSEEEKKEEAKNASSENSLSQLRLEDIAPPKDVQPVFFGSRKTEEGANKYEKIQVSFRSSIPLEFEIEGAKSKRKDNRHDYRMEIYFDNITKIEWFQTIEQDGRIEAVYDGASDEDRNQDNELIDTTIMIHLKRPATFWSTKNQNRKILSPFALPQADQRNQLPNFWNLNQVIFLKGKKEIACDLESILDSLVADELIPNSVKNLSYGGWQQILMSYDEIKSQQDEFLQLAEQF